MYCHSACLLAVSLHQIIGRGFVLFIMCIKQKACLKYINFSVNSEFVRVFSSLSIGMLFSWNYSLFGIWWTSDFQCYYIYKTWIFSLLSWIFYWKFRREFISYPEQYISSFNLSFLMQVHRALKQMLGLGAPTLAVKNLHVTFDSPET